MLHLHALMLDGELLTHMFEETVDCMSLYELPLNFCEKQEAHDMYPNVFQELWGMKIECFFETSQVPYFISSY